MPSTLTDIFTLAMKWRGWYTRRTSEQQRTTQRRDQHAQHASHKTNRHITFVYLKLKKVFISKFISWQFKTPCDCQILGLGQTYKGYVWLWKKISWLVAKKKKGAKKFWPRSWTLFTYHSFPTLNKVEFVPAPRLGSNRQLSLFTSFTPFLYSNSLFVRL